MFRMKNTTITQEDEKVLARIETLAYDNRTGKTETLVIFCELTSEEQDASTVAKKALGVLGYIYQGIQDVETTSLPYNTEQAWHLGKKKEEADLRKY